MGQIVNSIVRLPALIKRSGLSRSSIYRLIKEDSSFPQQIKLSTRAMGFLESDIDLWISGRVDASKAGAK